MRCLPTLLVNLNVSQLLFRSVTRMRYPARRVFLALCLTPETGKPYSLGA